MATDIACKENRCVNSGCSGQPSTCFISFRMRDVNTLQYIMFASLRTKVLRTDVSGVDTFLSDFFANRPLQSGYGNGKRYVDELQHDDVA